MLYSQTKGNQLNEIIFLHGNSQSIELWDAVINEKVLEDYTLVTVDLPGHGKSFTSRQPEKDYSIQGMAEHLKEFIIQHSNYIVVANSASTNLIGEIAHLLTNCKGIFLIGANIIGEDISASDVLKPNPNLIPFFTANPSDEELDKMIDEGSYNISPNSKKECKEIYRKTDPAFREHWFASISKQEWTDEIKILNTLALPIGIVYGQEDKFVQTHYLDKSSIKKWRDQIITIPKAGHLIQYDQPKVLAVLIKEFAVDCFK